MFISEIIETRGEGEGQTEICATAEAQYDSAGLKVSVALNSFVRCVCPSGNPENQTPSWLPRADHVSEYLAHDEADAFTKDVFQSWVKKVRATIPHDLPSTI
ncbi:MAG: hypothetical protein JWL59_3513 [Chthoniobacteraceae bacterium]|nr:hypothetical protein [Chthoniobacteraceae bacterium]